MSKEQENDHHFDRNNIEENQEQKHPFQVVYDGNAIKNKRDSEPISVFHRPEIKRKSQKKRLLPFILTILSASVISIFFGMTILKLFVVMDEQPVSEGNNPETTAAVTTTSTQTKAYQIPELSGYALQAGVFMEKENAEEWMQYYENNNVPIIIWEQDNQYFLFTGIYATEEAAKIEAAEFKTDGYDIFAKPWSTIGGEINLTDDEFEWLNNFQEVWKTSLTTKDSETLIETANSAPASNPFTELLEQLQLENIENREQFYLNIFYSYEQLGKDI